MFVIVALQLKEKSKTWRWTGVGGVYRGAAEGFKPWHCVGQHPLF